MKILSFIFSALFCASLQAQDIKRTAVWYFGEKAGLDFNTNPPTVLTNGAMKTEEGCATISDTSGKLLFYTDGTTVWNKNHQIMDNGDSLGAYNSAVQTSIIIPLPGSETIYYLITNNHYANPASVEYNVVDMSLNNGFGKVIVKRKGLLYTPIAEKLAAVKHQNGIDYWITVVHNDSNIYYTFLLTKEGIIRCPIEQKVGINTNFDQAKSLKFSSDGKYLVNGLGFNNFKGGIELFNFNNSNGEITSKVLIEGAIFTYGLEFSHDNRFIFVTSDGRKIYSIDLKSLNNDSIKNSLKVIYDYGVPDTCFTLQKDIYGNIIVAKPSSTELGIINVNDSPIYKTSGYYLNGKTSSYGLPNFVSSFFYKPRLDIWYKLDCTSDSAWFYHKTDSPIAFFYTWILEKNSTIVYATMSHNPVFLLKDTGTYTVTLIIDNDTVKKQFYKSPNINPNFLGADKIICDTVQVILDAGTGYYCYKWQDTLKTQQITATKSGKYYCTVTNNNWCSATDTINISFGNTPRFSLGLDETICPGTETLELEPFPYSKNKSYLWNSGQTDSTLLATQPGEYWLQLSDSAGCVAFDTIYLSEKCDPHIFIPNAFTPNGDMVNGKFKIFADNLIYYHLRIYTNNTTQPLFETDDINTSWDGTYKGELCPVGNYLFILEYKTPTDDKIKQIAGKLLLLK